MLSFSLQVFLLRDSHVYESKDGWNFVATTIGCNTENKVGLCDLTCHLEIEYCFLQLSIDKYASLLDDTENGMYFTSLLFGLSVCLAVHQ